MKENKVIKNYLNNLNESEVAKILIIRILAPVLIFSIFFILFSFLSSKRNRRIESKIRKITGLFYKVYVLPVNDVGVAYCFGGITGKNLFLSKGTVKELNERELMAVCIHEIAHVQNIDSIKTLCSLFGISIPSYFLLKKIIETIEKTNFIKKNVLLDIILLTLVCSTFVYGLSYIFSKKARKSELRADSLTIKYGYEKDLISALKRIEPDEVRKERQRMKREKNKFTIALNKITHLFDSHPDVEERTKKLLESKKLHDALKSRNKHLITKTIKEFILQEN